MACRKVWSGLWHSALTAFVMDGLLFIRESRLYDSVLEEMYTRMSYK